MPNRGNKQTCFGELMDHLRQVFPEGPFRDELNRRDIRMVERGLREKMEEAQKRCAPEAILAALENKKGTALDAAASELLSAAKEARKLEQLHDKVRNTREWQVAIQMAL
jgi:hypothetical protein